MKATHTLESGDPRPPAAQMTISSRSCAVLPNPSLKLTRYGKHCKAGLRHTMHHLSPALQCSPPRAA